MSTLFIYLTASPRIYIKNSRNFTIPEQGFVVKFGGFGRERAICFLAFPQEQFLFAGVLHVYTENSLFET